MQSSPIDAREFNVSVAGPAGMLIAKIYKIDDRASDPDRRADKDALDILRLLQTLLARRLRILEDDELSGEVTSEALERFPDLFGRPNATGCAMAARAAGPLADPDMIAAAASALSGDLIAEMGRPRP